jgi:hypothetical protein
MPQGITAFTLSGVSLGPLPKDRSTYPGSRCCWPWQHGAEEYVKKP